jgi:hypothetical protein
MHEANQCDRTTESCRPKFEEVTSEGCQTNFFFAHDCVPCGRLYREFVFLIRSRCLLHKVFPVIKERDMGYILTNFSEIGNSILSIKSTRLKELDEKTPE